MSQPLIRKANADGLVPRWLDPRLAVALENLPEYGQLTITVSSGRVQREITVTKTILLPQDERKTPRT